MLAGQMPSRKMDGVPGELKSLVMPVEMPKGFEAGF
jgi:hypothetical protein